MARRIGAVLLLLAAAGLYLKDRPDLLAPILPAPPSLSPEAKKAQRIIGPVIARCSREQRQELAAFYGSAARAVPKLAKVDPNLTSAKMRSILELAVRIHFSDEWNRVPGLADAIHGPNGAIAQIYGLEQERLDGDRFSKALAGIAQACQP